MTTLGPLAYERGVLHGMRWEQNRNGIMFTYPGMHDQRDAVSERAFRDPSDERDVRLIGESPPLNAYVVEVNPSGGRHEWRFIDKRTGNLVRREYVERRRRYTSTYDDYRTVDGVPEPSRVRTVDSLGNEREQMLLSRSLDHTPDPRDVDMPPSRARSSSFPSKQHDGPAAGALRQRARRRARHRRARRVRFLARLRRGRHRHRPVGRRPAEPRTYGTARRRDARHVPGIDDDRPADDDRRRCACATSSTRVVTIPFHVDDRTHIAGLLGFDFFADTVVHVDLAKNLAEAIAPDRFHPPADASAVGIALDDKTPAVRARAGSANGRVVLDTGANRTVFETAFAERADFAPERVASITHVRGMGGYANAEPTRLPTFEIGGIWTRGATADVANADLGTEDVDGIIGTDLLRTYDMWFDYKLSTVYVRRAKR